MNEFKKESRYIVVKIKDLQSNSMKQQGDFYSGLESLQLPERHYVCVESDWPEYDLVWRMIQDRVEGKPNEIEALRAQLAEAEKKLARSEPVAWMMETTHKTSGEKSIWISTNKDGWRGMTSVTYGEQVPLYTTPQTAPDTQALVNAAVDAALKKVLAAVKEINWLSDEELSSIEIAISEATPSDTSSLDEYKADIKRLVEAVEILTDGSFADSMQLMTKNGRKWLSDIKAKYNL